MVADGRVRERHELVEHGELQFQLDAVHHRFQSRFNLVEAGILHPKEHDVHGNDDGINPYQLHHHLSRPAMINRPQQLDGRVDVDARYDKLLDAERSHLQPFDPVEGIQVPFVVGRIGPVGEDRRRNMEDDGINDDHSQNAPKHFLFSNHQV